MSVKDQLHEKMTVEYLNYIVELKKQPPEKIVEGAYEKVLKEEILLSVQGNDMPDEKAQALLDLDYPLDELYQEWCASDYSYTDMILDSINETAQSLITTPEKKMRGYFENSDYSAISTDEKQSEALNGSLTIGDWVLSMPTDEYGCLIGQVTDIAVVGSPEHDTDNPTDDICVDFTAFEYPAHRKTEIEREFKSVYGDFRPFDELPLDLVIMCPENLIRITELPGHEIDRLGELRENSEAYCNCFDDYGEKNFTKRESELVSRIEQEYSNFTTALSGFNPSELISMAGKIQAMSDAREFALSEHEFSDDELRFFLQFQSPLEVIADHWLERFSDTSDISFALDYINDHKAPLLGKYPLIDQCPDSGDNGLRRFMNVDLVDFLGKITEKVIVHYPDDWQINVRRLHLNADCDDPDDKRFMWHVSSYGTHMNTERDTFIQDTSAYNAWVNYRPNDPDMFGYAVEITGRKGNIIIGNVFEIGNYAEHARYVAENALPVESVSLTYGDSGVYAGETITVPFSEYNNDRHRLMSESGNVKRERNKNAV